MRVDFPEVYKGRFMVDSITNHCQKVMLSRTPIGNFILSLYAKENFPALYMTEFYRNIVPAKCKEQGIELHFDEDYYWFHLSFERDEDYTWFILRWS